MAAAWLLALVALPVAPVPASAQTEIWAATLTVDATTFPTTAVGYLEGFIGTLSDTDFVRDGTTHRVTDFSYVPEGGLLDFGLATALEDTCGLVLKAGAAEFKFRDVHGEISGVDHLYRWLTPSPGWTDNQSVEVKLVVSDGSPCAPTGLTATAQNGRVALAWTAGGNGDTAITKHQVCRMEGSFAVCTTTDWADILESAPPDGANATSYTVPSLENGTEYTFRVRAVNEDGGGIASNEATATPMATAPDAPTGLTAEAGDESVTLRWTAPALDGGSDITGYEYRQKTTGGFGSWQDIELSAPGEANATSYPVTSLANDTAYTFEVQARNAEGASGPSNQASATPVAGDTTAPVLMSATTTALEVGLTYDENLDGGSEPAPSAFTVTVDGASRAVTGVSVGAKVLLTLASAVRAGDLVRVSYTVPAMNPLRDEASNPAAAFADHPVTNEVPATAPEAPTGLTATPGDGSVTLRWTASAYDGGSEVTSHQYRRKTTGGFGSWQDIELSAPGEANATSYPVTSLMNDTAYTFEVQARNEEGESGPSNQASATPVPGDSTAPVLQSATTTALEVGLTYDEALDADSEPSPSAFTVTVDGASRAVTGVSVGAKVLLTLASAVRAGDLVTVSYTVPAMNPLRDEANNPAAAFADHPVTNETPATAPDAPTNLGRVDPRRRVGDPAVDGALRRRERGHGPPVPAEDGRSLRVLAGHRAERAGRGERDQLPGDEPHERHGVHLRGAGPERGGRQRPVQPGERDPGRRRQHRAGAPERDDDRACARADL